MAGELLCTVHPGQATRATTINLADAGLTERADLQEWVRANPEIVGDDILIVTFEFDGWEGRRGREADRPPGAAHQQTGQGDPPTPRSGPRQHLVSHIRPVRWRGG